MSMPEQGLEPPQAKQVSLVRLAPIQVNINPVLLFPSLEPESTHGRTLERIVREHGLLKSTWYLNRVTDPRFYDPSSTAFRPVLLLKPSITSRPVFVERSFKQVSTMD